MKERVQEERDKDLISKLINFKKNYHDEIERVKAVAIQAGLNFMNLEAEKKLRIGLILFILGFLGLIVSAIATIIVFVYHL